MVVAHLTSSTFYGGPERQILELARHMSPAWQSIVLSYGERGGCRAFLEAAQERGVEARMLAHDTPWLMAAIAELQHLLRQRSVRVLCCHGYKADLTGRLAARRLGIPAIAVSRGWTGESWKVRLYEAADRRGLRKMDFVVCVSEGQAAKVRQAGVAVDRVAVIRNSICPERFDGADNAGARQLSALFPERPRRIVAAAGRLSPEKGFDVLVEAARVVCRTEQGIGFVLFGEGRERASLARRISALGLEKHFVLAGFHGDLDRLLPHVDLMVLPSYTEGLPNILLEAFAAGIPAVGTRVGGIPEVIEHGATGCLTTPGNAAELADAILRVMGDERARHAMGRAARERVVRDFSFAAQSAQYQQLFERLLSCRSETAKLGVA